MKLFIIIPLILSTADCVLAEVRENNCPFNCDTENINRAYCRDWKDNGKCYIEDLSDDEARARLGHTGDASSFDPELERQIITVNKEISSGSTEAVSIMSRPIDRIDLVLKRLGTSTQTQVRANIGESKQLGQKQVDQNVQHVISFPVLNVSKPGEKLELTAVEGNIYMESVHIIYRK